MKVKKGRRKIPLGGERDALLALVREKGSAGAREQELAEFFYLGEEGLLRLSQELEAEGVVKILSFRPLFLISGESFDFLCRKIIAYLENFHRKNPSRRGVPREKIRDRFNLSERVLTLVVRTLERKRIIRQDRDILQLPDHEPALSADEERILQRLEEMCDRGGLRSVSLESLKKELGLSSERLDKLLSLLVERNKVVQGPEGLIIHSRWLDEIIGRVRALGKEELTVGEFKVLTGLSRKYAIPLLELLDQVGVTRRRGSTRQILKGVKEGVGS